MVSSSTVATPESRLPEAVRAAVLARTGPLRAVRIHGQGRNNDLAALLTPMSGPVVFLKALHEDRPQSWTQAREAAVNPYVLSCAPQLLWSLADGGWHVNAFEALQARAARYAPGSNDLVPIVELLTTLSQAGPAPEGLGLSQMPARMSSLSTDAGVLAGTTLLHTDWNPTNVQVTVDGLRLVDWAWASVGAAWVDAAGWCVWLIRAGHTPAGAEAWALRVPVLADTDPTHVDVFAEATATLWAGAATQRGSTWHADLAAAAAAWSEHRRMRR
ncbi:MAG: hypothetical protein QG608_1907 [Actinomycetota bacterium]|nr:hypothetical protein [Actinomycetota bacterium]